jgi:hypothetical protein
MEAATLKICTMLAASAGTSGQGLLDTQGSNERVLQAGELEEVCGVAEHDGYTQGDLPEERETRYDESPLKWSDVTARRAHQVGLLKKLCVRSRFAFFVGLSPVVHLSLEHDVLGIHIVAGSLPVQPSEYPLGVCLPPLLTVVPRCLRKQDPQEARSPRESPV